MGNPNGGLFSQVLKGVMKVVGWVNYNFFVNLSLRI